MSKINPQIESSWKKILKDEFQKDYFKNLKDFLIEEKKIYEIYPPSDKIFAAFDNCPFDKLKVVIIWQDPYHGPWQANWMCFSVNEWIPKPPSLQNIFKEINDDMWIEIPQTWNLSSWAKQWVLLLNTTLTVRKWQANSHNWQWWEEFTDNVIKTISDKKSWIVFLLWWNFAKEKQKLIDSQKHHTLQAAHPSPFSAHRWFFGSKHFSKTNKILKEQWKETIIWKI